MKSKTILALAGLNGFVATGLAAIGSHAIHFEGKSAALFQQAIEFHFWHALAMIGCAYLSSKNHSKAANISATFFIIGIAGFSCSLYWRAVMGAGSLGSFHWITPIGGLFLMTGWATLVFGALKLQER